MGKSKSKAISGKTVRIWIEPKKRLQKFIAAKAKKERRIVSEAEIVSTAVDMLCDIEERKVGIV